MGYHDGNGDYDVGDTGGAASVTLTTNQIPSHAHHVGHTYLVQVLNEPVWWS